MLINNKCTKLPDNLPSAAYTKLRSLPAIGTILEANVWDDTRPRTISSKEGTLRSKPFSNKKKQALEDHNSKINLPATIQGA